jgi:hypothetical protein
MKKLTKETVENVSVEGTIEDILKDATKSKSKSNIRAAGEAGVLTIVNAKTGTRFAFSSEVLEKLENPTELQVSYDESKKIIIVGENLVDNENTYPIRKNGKKGIIYSKLLVDEITEAMKLDFSNRTSITFQEAEYLNDEQYLIAIIKIK